MTTSGGGGLLGWMPDRLIPYIVLSGVPVSVC